jgi:hypothetical protein
VANGKQKIPFPKGARFGIMRACFTRLASIHVSFTDCVMTWSATIQGWCTVYHFECEGSPPERPAGCSSR